MDNLKIESSLKSHFLNLYSIALSNFEIDINELEMLYKLGEERGINPEEINKIILSANDFVIPTIISEKIIYLYDFARMIWADNKVDEFERNALVKFIKVFGFVEENAADIANFLIDEAKKNTPVDEIILLVNKNT